MNSVCVVLVNFKNKEKTVDCLRALEKSSVQPSCVYIIDNASTEESQQYFWTFTFNFGILWHTN